VASDLSFVQHVCDQLGDVAGVAYRKMFGEYAIYAGEKVVALVCDNRLFVKPTDAGRALLGSPLEGSPYPGAKPYFAMDEHLDDRDLLAQLLRATESSLPAPKPKKRRP